MEKMKKDDLRIVLLGKTGAGKSASGNTILGKEIFQSKFSAKSITQDSQQGTACVGGRCVTVLDTPGLLDTRHGPKLFEMALQKIQAFAQKRPCIFLNVIRLDRFTDEEFEAIKIIQGRFKQLPRAQFMLLFTGGDQLDGTIEEFIEDSDNGLKEVVKYYRCKYHVFNNKNQTNSNQVSHLLSKMEDMAKIPDDPQTVSKDEEIQQIWEEMTKMFGSDELMIQRIFKETKGGAFRVPEEDPEPRRIVLLGKTGTGKSSLGNTILGRKVFVPKLGMKPVTKKCQKEEAFVCSKQVIVVDTPVFFDITQTEQELFSEVKKCISLSSPGPHAFLLVVSARDRVTKDTVETIELLNKYFGEDFKKHTMILFTHSDCLENETVDDRINSSPALKTVLAPFAGRVHSVNNESSDPKQVEELLIKIDKMAVNGVYTDKMFSKAQIAIQEKEAYLKKYEPVIKEKTRQLIQSSFETLNHSEAAKESWYERVWVRVYFETAIEKIAGECNAFIDHNPLVDACLSGMGCFVKGLLTSIGAFATSQTSGYLHENATAFTLDTANMAKALSVRTAEALAKADDGRRVPYHDKIK